MFKKIFFCLAIFFSFVGLLTFGLSETIGKQKAPSLSTETVAPVLLLDGESLATETKVVIVSSEQVCKTRMKCGCKHRSGDTDSLKKHSPEEDPFDDQNSWSAHLDLKCTKCDDRWYCPVFKRFRDLD